MRRPGVPVLPAVVLPVDPPVNPPVPPAVRPLPSVPAPVASPVRAAPVPYAPAPLLLPPALQPGTSGHLMRGADAGPAATATAKAQRPVSAIHRSFGLSSDVGMPDGLNLGLILSPTYWLRMSAALGTNSASLGYRGGLSLVPMGWGPSFTVEAGHCNTAPTTSVIRTFFSVPSWVQSYVQQLGYTYVNAQVGFDYRIGGLTVFLHGGYTFLKGTIRSPDPVVVDSKTNTSVKIAEDGSVSAYTLSAKAGLIYMFGGS